MSFVLDCENEKNGFSVEDVLTVPVEQTGPVLPSGTDLGYIGDHTKQHESGTAFSSKMAVSAKLEASSPPNAVLNTAERDRNRIIGMLNCWDAHVPSWISNILMPSTR